MGEKTFTYECQVTWEQERRGHAQATGRPMLHVGAPPEFNGTDDVWSPEHLAAAALNSCMMLTFIAVAATSKVPFSAYTSQATATLEKVEGRGMAITNVLVRPRITVPAETDRSKLDRVLELTKKHCFISNSLTATVTLEPEIVVG